MAAELRTTGSAPAGSFAAQGAGYGAAAGAYPLQAGQQGQFLAAQELAKGAEERARYQHSLHRILDAAQPYTFLWCRAEIGAYDRRWRGVRFYPKRPGFDLTEWYLPADLQEGR